MANNKEIIKYEPGKFCGVISSSLSSLEEGALKKLILQLLRKRGCLVYVYNSIEDLNRKVKIFKSWNLDYEGLVRANRIIYVSSQEKYLNNGVIDHDKIIKYYKDLIDKCRKNQYEDIIFLGRRDGFYSKHATFNDMAKFHRRIKELCQQKEIMIFTTYIVDVLNEERFFELMPLHDMFILDDDNQSYLYLSDKFEEVKLVFKFLRKMFIDKAELYKDKKKLEFLNKLIMKISYKESQGELLNEALNTISTIVGADFGYMLSYSKEKKRNIVARYNLPYGFLEELEKLSYEKHTPHRYSSNNVIVNNSNEYINPVRYKIVKIFEVKSVIEIPIKEENKVAIGAIFLFFTQNNEFMTKHVPFLEAVSNTLLALLKKHEESAEQKKELIKAEKLKNLGELAGGIAHDFNNILTSILGFSIVALERTDNKEMKEYLEIINQSALDGRAIVDKIQTLTKKRTNKIKEIVNFNKIVESSIQMARPKWKNFYESKGVKLDLIRALNSQGHVYCNEHEIREGILNIIFNAMDAMEEGGSLRISTYDKEDKVYLEIEDNGVGMTQEVKEQIFEPFYSTKEARGTGLGLSISKEIFEEHGGKIGVESRENCGTKFIIEFKNQIGQGAIEKEKYTIPTFDSIKSLVVDDKDKVARSLKELLGMLEVKSDIETNSEKVIEKLSNSKYDVIFCDLAMPKVSGLDLAKQIKLDYPETKFILMTGWPENINDEYLDKIDYILEKPCMIEDLAKALDEVKSTC
ncbi:hybrid sensor histidine kinase/response regulator [Sporosalibacterium faouarense]|uniref:hybrid sensor histidine kinase/response regulator n=1 Tax=Sporosalibacterium faouarense TaxID=516123 RepID=UPI00141C953C|nr:hybrid sensor histidine kinase/response regulator [Sporosalibacterium faouarense]MTI46778.1 response regulator [Bacillota bacterium]